MRLMGQQGDRYMPFGFDRRKAIQAVAFLLKTRPDARDNYMRLLKILYMADRESIKETSTPITGDRFVCMEHGTMLNRLLNLVKHEDSPILKTADYEDWNTHFVREGEYDIRLVSDPGIGALCEYEIRKLEEVAKRYRNHSQWDMREETHKLPEYHDPGRSSVLISLKQFLETIGLGDRADQIIEEAEDCASMSRLIER